MRRMVPDYVFIGAGGHASEMLEASKSTSKSRTPVLGEDYLFAVSTPEQQRVARERWRPKRPDDVLLIQDLLFCLLAHEKRFPRYERPPRFVLAIGDVRARRRIVTELDEQFKRPFLWASVQHTTSWLCGQDSSVRGNAHARMATYMGAHSYVGPGVRLGQHVAVNRGAHVAHDAVVEHFTHVAPGAQVLGGAKIGSDCLIGANAVIFPGVTVGSRCLIGAGVVVRKDMPDDSVMRLFSVIRRTKSPEAPGGEESRA